MNEQIPAYVLARSGRMRDGLVALLRAVPWIGDIQQVTNELTELKPIPEHNQALVLLDASLIDQERWNSVKQVNGERNHTQYKYIVLVDTPYQQQMAKAAGADEVLLAGFPAAQFFSTLDNLFNQAGSQPVEMGRRNGTAYTY